MAYQLVEEVLANAPDMSYREFRILVAIASEARLPHRSAAPGMTVLQRKAGYCSRRVVQRGLAGLERRGLIKRTAPGWRGHRQRIELLPMGDATPSPFTGLERVSDPDQRVTDPGRKGDATPPIKGDATPRPLPYPVRDTLPSLSRTPDGPGLDATLARLGATPAEVSEMKAWAAAQATHNPRGYLWRCLTNGAGSDILAEIRGDSDDTAAYFDPAKPLWRVIHDGLVAHVPGHATQGRIQCHWLAQQILATRDPDDPAAPVEFVGRAFLANPQGWADALSAQFYPRGRPWPNLADYDDPGPDDHQAEWA